MDVQAKTDPKEDASAEILKGLRSRRGADRATALARLDELTPDQAVDILLAGLERDRRSRRFWPVKLIAVLLVLWLVAFALGERSLRAPMMNFIQIAVQLLVAGLIASNHLRAGTYRALAAYQDPRAVDPLVTAMTSGPAETRRPAQEALVKLLPKLRPADSPLVSPASRRALDEMLVTNVRVDFVLAILAAWEQIGDEHAIPYVDRLSRGDAALGENRAVREAAEAAMPAIREAARRTSTAGVLLRAAEPDNETTPLLRPASATESEDTAALLRPAAE